VLNSGILVRPEKETMLRGISGNYVLICMEPDEVPLQRRVLASAIFLTFGLFHHCVEKLHTYFCLSQKEHNDKHGSHFTII
jgi:hypothetical protein